MDHSIEGSIVSEAIAQRIQQEKNQNSECDRLPDYLSNAIQLLPGYPAIPF